MQRASDSRMLPQRRVGMIAMKSLALRIHRALASNMAPGRVPAARDVEMEVAEGSWDWLPSECVRRMSRRRVPSWPAVNTSTDSSGCLRSTWPRSREPHCTTMAHRVSTLAADIARWMTPGTAHVRSHRKVAALNVDGRRPDSPGWGETPRSGAPGWRRIPRYGRAPKVRCACARARIRSA